MIIRALLLVCLLSISAAAAPFTDVSVTGTAYLTDDVINELAETLNRRYNLTVLGVSTNTYVAVGDTANRRAQDVLALLSDIRNAVYNAYTEWLQEEPPSSFTAPSDILYTNAQEWCEAAGLPSRGWRRATAYDPATNDWRNPADPMYGTATNWSSGFTEGEILGPWVIDDLQIGLAAMRYCLMLNVAGTRFSWSALGTTNYYTGSALNQATFAAVQAATEADFAPYSSSDNAPSVSTHADKDAPANYDASAIARQAAMVISATYTNSSVHRYGGGILYYAQADRAYSPGWSSTNNVWDANGTVLVEGQFTLFDQDSITAGSADRSSGMLGTTSFPAWCREPADGESSAITGPRRGFQVYDALIFWVPDQLFSR